MTSPSASRRDLVSAWMVLRLAIRTATTQYARGLSEKASALSADPMDPDVLQDLVRRLGAELARQAGEGEPSPALRFLKNAFQPSDVEKERQHLERSFKLYVKTWQAATQTV